MPDPTDALVREAAAILAAALSQVGTLHLPGARDRHRHELQNAIARAEHVLAATLPGNAGRATVAAHITLARAHAARARDARHGAGQLSLSAQRAPTREACDDGWRRVASIVAVAERSAWLAGHRLPRP